MVAKGYSASPGVGNMLCIFLTLSTVSLYKMNSHYEKDWITYLFYVLNSCQSTGTQEVMNKMQKKKRRLSLFSVLPHCFEPHFCTSPHCSCVHEPWGWEDFLFFPSEINDVSPWWLQFCALLFIKGAPDTLYFNSSGIKSCSKAELWTCTI